MHKKVNGHTLFMKNHYIVIILLSLKFSYLVTETLDMQKVSIDGRSYSSFVKGKNQRTSIQCPTYD